MSNNFRESSQDKYIIGGTAAALILVGALAFWLSSKGPGTEPVGLPEVDTSTTTMAFASSLADCLKEKNVTMYGAEWCGACQRQKQLFGESFSKVPQVECTTDAKACVSQGIEKTPTWVFPDGKKIEGLMELQKLATEAGCSI